MTTVLQTSKKYSKWENIACGTEDHKLMKHQQLILSAGK